MTAEPIAAVVDHVTTARIVAIVRSKNADDAVTGGRQLLAAGVRVVEVSLNTPGAITAIASLAQTAHHHNAIVGAGTVTSARHILAVAAAGARFFVSPVLDPQTIQAAHHHGMAAIPGCATPTEMQLAHDCGAEAIKVFPATNWTPAGLANVIRALPHLRLIPTGGVVAADAAAWLRAGATALGVGSSLFGTPDGLRSLQDAVLPFRNRRDPR